MKKKLGLFTLCLASLSTIALTSCNKVSSEQEILNAFNAANKTVKTINQTISIRSGSFLLAEEKTLIEVEKSHMKVETKTANDLSAEKPYTEFVSENNSYSFERTEFKVKTDMFTSTELVGNTLKAVVENDYVFTVFGLEASKVEGSVAVEFKATALESGALVLNSVEIDYVSSNGNDVSISTLYSY